MSDEEQIDRKARQQGAKLVGEIIKKAVEVGAGAYVTAEDTVNRTLKTVQIPKEVIRDTLESFFEDYTIAVTAEIKLKPKRKKKDADEGDEI